MNRYLADIATYESLSRDEEVFLAREIAAGSLSAADKLICSNLWLPVKVANWYCARGILKFEDLVSEGNYGLIRAAYRFDPEYGARFTTYAVWWVRQSILQSLATHARTIRLPLNVYALLPKLVSCWDQLYEELERAPIAEEVASELQINASHVRLALAHLEETLSLAESSGSSMVTLLDIVSATVRSPDERLWHRSLGMSIQQAFDLLSSREAEVLRLYYGIAEELPLTLQAIGNRFGLTRERVRQIKQIALRKLETKPLEKEIRESLLPYLSGPDHRTVKAPEAFLRSLERFRRVPPDEELEQNRLLVGRGLRGRGRSANGEEVPESDLQIPKWLDDLVEEMLAEERKSALHDTYARVLAEAGTSGG